MIWAFAWLACGGGAITDTSTTAGGIGSGTTFFVDAKIGPVQLRAESNATGSNCKASQLTSAWGGFLVEAQTFGIGLGDTTPRFEIQNVAHFEDTPDDTDRWHILDVGTYPYGTLIQNENDDPSEYPGVNVKLWDLAGAYSDCSRSSGDQTSSYFEVSSHEDYAGAPLIDGTSVQAVTEGRFGCLLYDLAGVEVGELEGTFLALTTTF